MTGVFKIEISEGRRETPWRIMVYGTPGIGKSTFAAFAPEPLFIDLEHGLDRVACAKTQLLASLPEFIEGLRYAYQNPCKTVVVDSVTKLEDLLAAEVCRKQKVQVVGDIPWGKGPDMVVAEWQPVLSMFSKLQAAGKNILLIGHDEIREHMDPQSENYHRYIPRLGKKTMPLLVQEVDAVFFAHWEKFVKSKDGGKGRIGVGTGKRLLRAVEDPSAIAKNRFDLPELIDMEPAVFNRLK